MTQGCKNAQDPDAFSEVDQEIAKLEKQLATEIVKGQHLKGTKPLIKQQNAVRVILQQRLTTLQKKKDKSPEDLQRIQALQNDLQTTKASQQKLEQYGKKHPSGNKALSKKHTQAILAQAKLLKEISDLKTKKNNAERKKAIAKQAVKKANDDRKEVLDWAQVRLDALTTYLRKFPELKSRVPRTVKVDASVTNINARRTHLPPKVKFTGNGQGAGQIVEQALQMAQGQPTIDRIPLLNPAFGTFSLNFNEFTAYINALKQEYRLWKDIVSKSRPL